MLRKTTDSLAPPFIMVNKHLKADYVAIFRERD